MKKIFLVLLTIIYLKSSGQSNITVGEKAPQITITDWIDNVPKVKTLTHKILSEKIYSPLTYSKISPGWQSNTLQIASKVEKRTALALPVFKMERLDKVISTFSESSFNDIFRLAITTSRFTIIGMAYTVNWFSSCISTPRLKICEII